VKPKVSEIVLATTNKGKLGELREMLADRAVTVRGLADFRPLVQAKEDADTFSENARGKAIHYGKLLGRWVLADDSGLQVDALDGAPGVRSARFAGEKGLSRAQRDQANNEKLLRLLADVPAEKRTARFCCCLCLSNGAKVQAEVKGFLEGRIAEKGQGKNGFGYDPIFYVPRVGKTVAELSAEEKNAISHRGEALRKLLGFLERLLD